MRSSSFECRRAQHDRFGNRFLERARTALPAEALRRRPRAPIAGGDLGSIGPLAFGKVALLELAVHP